MLVYDWLWWGQLTNQIVCGGVQRCIEGCVEEHGGVHGGAQRCAEGCTEVHGGFSKRWWGKNQDFMLIRFLNAGI